MILSDQKWVTISELRCIYNPIRSVRNKWCIKGIDSKRFIAYHKFLLATSFFFQRHSFFVLFEVFSLRRLKIKPSIGKCFHVGKKCLNKRMKFILQEIIFFFVKTHNITKTIYILTDRIMADSKSNNFEKTSQFINYMEETSPSRYHHWIQKSEWFCVWNKMSNRFSMIYYNELWYVLTCVYL